MSDSFHQVAEAYITPSAFDRQARSYTGAVYDPEKIITEAQRLTDFHWRKADSERPPEGDSLTLHGGTYLGHFFCHFGHFLIETIPQLHWAQKLPRPFIFHPWKDATYRQKPLDLPYVRHVLEVLDIDRNDIIFVDGSALKVHNLYLPPRSHTVSAKPVHESITAYRDIADATLKVMPDEGCRRIYLSRRLFATDRGNNEAEVELLFRKYGFEVVHPERLPFAQQINLVARSEIIAGINGSAMHLGVFLPKGAWQINLGPRIWRIQKPILDILGVRGSMLPNAAPLASADIPINVALIEEWLQKNLD